MTITVTFKGVDTKKADEYAGAFNTTAAGHKMYPQVVITPVKWNNFSSLQAFVSGKNISVISDEDDFSLQSLAEDGLKAAQQSHYLGALTIAAKGVEKKIPAEKVEKVVSGQIKIDDVAKEVCEFGHGQYKKVQGIVRTIAKNATSPK